MLDGCVLVILVLLFRDLPAAAGARCGRAGTARGVSAAMSDQPQKQVIQTGQEGCVHDVQVDANGKYLASCSSFGKVTIKDLKSGDEKDQIVIKAHDGGVWQLAWAHPRAVGNTNTLATCGEDGKVVVWQETQAQKWEAVHTSPHVHEGGAVALGWAPFEHGCKLACGGADGIIAVLSKEANQAEWEGTTFLAHRGGVTGVSWAPFLCSGSLIQPNASLDALKGLQRFVSGGCDGHLRVWRCAGAHWEPTHCLSEHSSGGVPRAVRDVQWAGNCGLPFDYIASCADDKQVLVWRQEMPDKEWKHKVVVDGDVTPCRVSWSHVGSILAVSFEDHTVSLWREDRHAEWRMVSRVNQ